MRSVARRHCFVAHACICGLALDKGVVNIVRRGYGAAIDACARAGRWEEARGLLDEPVLHNVAYLTTCMIAHRLCCRHHMISNSWRMHEATSAVFASPLQLRTW